MAGNTDNIDKDLLGYIAGTGISIANGIISNTAVTPVYATIVYTNAATPATSTVFDDANPPVANDPALTQNVDNLYIGSDGSTWVWNGTAYVTKAVESSTPFYLAGGTVDAGSNKTANIYRQGRELIATDGSTQTTPLRELHIQAGGTTGMTSTFGRGAILSSNAGGGTRLYMEHTTAPSGSRAIMIYTDNGQFKVGSVSDTAGAFVRPDILTIPHATGLVGVNLAAPQSNLDVNGSFASAIRAVAGSFTVGASDYTVVATTAGANVILPAPATTNARRIYNIKNGTTGNITITGNIDGVAAATLTISSLQSRQVHSSGNTWWVI